SGYRHPTVERSLLRCAVGPDSQGSRASSTLQGGRNNRIQGVPALLIWSSASRRAAGGTYPGIWVPCSRTISGVPCSPTRSASSYCSAIGLSQVFVGTRLPLLASVIACCWSSAHHADTILR